MKSKIVTVLLTICLLLLQGIGAYAYDTSSETIREKQLEFASQYTYHEGDIEKSFNLYPDIIYTSGIEKRSDGSEYECPAIYIDDHAAFYDSYNLKKGEANFIINGKENQFSNQCILYNSRLLVPVEAFKEAGCYVNFNVNSYVTTISRDNTVLEILPNLIGMRKNQAEGFYVPLEVCARFIDETLYVPVRALSDELGIAVNWIADTRTVTLYNNN